MAKRVENQGPGAGTKYIVTVQGEPFEVFLNGPEGDEVVVASGKTKKKLHVNPKTHPFESVVFMGNAVFPTAVNDSDDGLLLYLGCREAEVSVKTERDLLIDKYRLDTQSEQKELKIVSPLPGLITKVHAENGMNLKKGDRIAIIEAMKMENEIQAPRNCTVKAINIEAGKTIDKGEVIAVLE